MTTQTPVFTINLDCPPLSEFQRQLEAELAAINAKWAESDAQFSRTMRIRRYLADRAGRLSALERRALKLQGGEISHKVQESCRSNTLHISEC